MAIEKNKQIEFGICIIQNKVKSFHKVPVDASVKTDLKEMLSQFDEIYLKEDAETFSPSEKYPPTKSLKIRLTEPYLKDIKGLYDLNNIPILKGQFDSIAHLILFYFASAFDESNNKIVAVKRPSQFKSLLKKKLIYFIDDTLKSLTDNIFKLDNDFDFVIGNKEIKIIHPSGFVFISNINEQITEAAILSLIDLSQSVPFIKFEDMEPVIRRSKTAAKLVASLMSRGDMNNTSQSKLEKQCKALGIKFRKKAGKIIPEDESALDFLNLLDRREYNIDLTDDHPEIYIAGSRSLKGSIK